MTDLELNVELAKAMGWVEFKENRDWFFNDGVGFRVYEGEIQCSYGVFDGFQTFDYRDPVIFVAICKRWKLDANFHKSRVDGFVCENVFSQLAYRNEVHYGSMEKAAALVVIEHAKQKLMLDKLAKKGAK